jgi:microcystin-dependent protein
MKTGNKIRYKGVYRLYRNGVPVSETPFDLTDAFGSTPAITVEELQLMTTQDIEARAAAMIEAIQGKCNDFEVINNIIYESNNCWEEDDFMIGQIIDFAGMDGSWDTEKWLNCDGSIVSASDYPELFAVIGNEWAYATLPTGMFALPDLQGRNAVGLNRSGSETPRNSTDYKLLNYGRVGNTGGKESVALYPSNLPEFEMSLPGQTGGDNDDMSNKTAFAGGDKTPSETSFNFNLPVAYSRGKGSGDYNQPHYNLPPYSIVWKLIRYKQ